MRICLERSPRPSKPRTKHEDPDLNSDQGLPYRFGFIKKKSKRLVRTSPKSSTRARRYKRLQVPIGSGMYDTIRHFIGTGRNTRQNGCSIVTSSNPKGGNLGGLTGGDAVGQSLAPA